MKQTLRELSNQIIYYIGRNVALIAGYACRSILEANAQREVFAEAGLMMDSALAVRDYTANEILPLLSERIQTEFPPQSVPFYAATQNFLRLREHHPEYTYKEAALNPTNPRDRAADWEGAQEPRKGVAAARDVVDVANRIHQLFPAGSRLRVRARRKARRAGYQLLDRAARYSAVGGLGGGDHGCHFRGCHPRVSNSF
jgi:hypothetical protein